MKPPLAEYGTILRSHWRWIVWGMLIALLMTTVYLLVEPPMYRTHATVFIRTPGDVTTVVDGGDSYAQGRARTYAALANSPELAVRVATDLGLDIKPQTLQRRIHATNPAGTVLIDFSVDAPSAAESRRTATVLLGEYSTQVRDLEAVPGSLVPRAEFVVVSPPREPARVSARGLPIPVLLAAAALVGLFLGATGAVLRSILKNPEPGGVCPQQEAEIVAATTSSDQRGEDTT